MTDRPCTCHPDDNPPQPCPKKYALSECRAVAQPTPETQPGAPTFDGADAWNAAPQDDSLPPLPIANRMGLYTPGSMEAYARAARAPLLQEIERLKAGLTLQEDWSRRHLIRAEKAEDELDVLKRASKVYDAVRNELAAEVERLKASERSAWNAAVVRDEQIERLTAERDALRALYHEG